MSFRVAVHLPNRQARLALVLLSLLALGFAVIIARHWRIPAAGTSSTSSSGSASAGARSVRAENGAVACPGRIEPLDGVLHVAAGYLEGRPQRVSELKVKEGDRVRAGQELAVLDGKGQLQTALRLAEARVDLARTRLMQVRAGARSSDIAAQEAQVAELRATLENARSEYHRYESLQEKTDVSSAELDAQRLVIQTTEQKLQRAEELLKSISEVRPTDIEVAESELRVALAEADHARTELRSAAVYSPATGRVLKIHTHTGEEVGPQGLLDLGKTDSMYVKAEVYENDISRVRPGQQAVITSDLFSGRLSGVVENVGTTIAKSSVLPLDPLAFADTRVFEVRIRLEHGMDVSGFINGKVNVVIQP